MVVGIAAAVLAVSLLLELPVTGFSIIEFLRLRGFDKRIYHLGWPLVRMTLPLPPPSADLISAGTITKEEGRFKFVEANQCLFTLRWGAFSLQKPHRHFRIKGTATWGHGGAEITGRLPLGPVLFIFLGVVASAAGSVIMCVRESVAEAVVFWLVGGGCTAVLLFHIRIERRSMDRMIAELEEILQS